VKAGPVEAS